MIFYDIPVSASTWSTEDYERRFKYVKGELMRAVVDHDELRLCGRHINYSLHMIGCSAETAVPSILIECRKCDLKSLRDLFNPRVTDRLYCRKESTWHKLFNSDTRPPKPPFQLVYLATDQHPTRRYAGKDPMTALRRPIQTLCGALVEHQGRMATISLTLMVDGIGRPVTVDHLFSGDLEDETSLCTIDNNSSQPPQDAEDDSYDQQSASQIEIEETQEDEDSVCAPTTFGDTHNTLFLSTSNTTSASQNENWISEGAIKGEMIEPLVPLHDSAPYLDWALVDTDTQPSNLQIRNLVFPNGTSDPILLQNIANRPRFHGVPVYMVSGREGLRNGRLLGGLGYLGARPGHEPCPVWTLLLDSPKGLTPGECGSIVVDQQTFEVYGHVVGANIMQHIYVVPFKEIVKQVRLSFNATTVCLPQLRPPYDISSSVNLSHQSGQKAYGPVRFASPQLADAWTLFTCRRAILSEDENKSLLTMLQQFAGEFNEVQTFMLHSSDNRRAKRRADYVETFCKGGQFSLDSSVPQSANYVTLPDLPYKARVFNSDPPPTSDSTTPGIICSDLELYRLLSQQDGWAYQLSFQFPFWVIFPQDYEDPRPPDDNGRPFRRRTDLSALIPDGCLVDSDSYDYHYLHEAVISVTITGLSEEYWTVFCFEDGPPNSPENEELWLPDELLVEETALYGTSPRSYFLHVMATSLERISDHQEDVLDLFQDIFHDKIAAAASSSRRQEPSSAVSFRGDMRKILEELIASISGITTKIQRFLSEDAVIGPEEIPKGPYMRSLRDDEHAMKLFRRIMKCRSSIEDTQSQFRLLVKRMDELEGVQLVMDEPLLLQRLLQSWKAVSFVLMVIIQFASVVILAWIAGRLRP
ncbi:hypothetical protein FDECE_1051 [Fusarium decemcellulare]|nr:hypothetical protein FDECE_1051 [Fusarium decemcellulare]